MKYLIAISTVCLMMLSACTAAALTNHSEYYPHGWKLPLLYGSKKIADKMIDFDPTVEGEETRWEEYILPDDDGRVIRLSHNGRVFAYVVDIDLVDPWEYQLVDYDGSGGFEMKEVAFSDFPLPRWTFVNYPFPYVGGRHATDLTGVKTPSVDQLVSALSPQDEDCVEAYTPQQRAALTLARGGMPPPEKCVAKKKPAESPRVALNILFEFDKDVLTAEAKNVLDNLGRAMTSKELADSRFRLEGHTDAVGNYDYNMDLSRRRANAVQKYLLERFKLTNEQLVPVGFGESQPLMNIDPEDGRNRRVEVVNLSAGGSLMTSPEADYQKLPPDPYKKIKK